MIQQSVRKSWWLFLFIAALFFFYSHGIEKRLHETDLLKERLSFLDREKQEVEEEREELLLEIDSFKDPDFIEMTLKKRLGLVAEGETKVYFKQNEPAK